MIYVRGLWGVLYWRSMDYIKDVNHYSKVVSMLVCVACLCER